MTITYNHPCGTPCEVEAVAWTPHGRVTVRRRGLLNAYYSADIFALVHPQGRQALAAELARLPRTPGAALIPFPEETGAMIR